MKTINIILVTLLTVNGFSGLLQAQVDFGEDDIIDIARIERDASAWKFSSVQGETGANYDVKWYRCWWDIDPAVRAISGNITTLFTPVGEGLDSLSFELQDVLTVDSVRYHNNPVNWEHNSNILNINFSTSLPPEIVDSVTVYYHGVPPAGSDAFVKTTHQGVPVIYTLSVPYEAGHWWPCKIGLTDKADSIDIYIRTPIAYSTATVGILVSESNDGVNKVYHWKHRYPIANYVINIAVTNYVQYTQQVTYDGNSLDILNCVYPEDSATLVSQTEVIIPAIQLFDSLFGIYPFQNEKYGNAQYPTVGMENQTMSFLSNFSYNVLTHELAHQWFGNKITCGSWSDIWLNEGFAVYLTGLCYEHFNPGNWKARRKGHIDLITSLPGGSVYCPDTLNQGRLFDHRLSYEKGAMILHQLRWIMGDSAFFAGLRNYISDASYAYGFVRTSDLKSHLESSCGQDLTWYFDDWYTGQGYPTYSVNIIQSPGSDATWVTIDQNQSHSSVSFFEMPVPIQFFGAGKDTTLIFDHEYSGQLFATDPGFLIDSTKFDPDLWIITGNNVITMGVDDLPAGKELKLMPNPAGDFLYVRHNLEKINSIDILNMDGKKESVNLKKAEGTGIGINIQNLKPGMYLLRIAYNEGIVTRKFLKR